MRILVVLALLILAPIVLPVAALLGLMLVVGRRRMPVGRSAQFGR